MNTEKTQLLPQAQQFADYKKAIQTKFKDRDVDFESVAKTTKRAFEITRGITPTENSPSSTNRSIYSRNSTLLKKHDVPEQASRAFMRVWNLCCEDQHTDFEHFMNNQLPLLNVGNVDGLKVLAEIYAEKFNYQSGKDQNLFDIIHKEGNSWANKVAELQKKVSKKFDDLEDSFLKAPFFLFFISALSIYFGTSNLNEYQITGFLALVFMFLIYIPIYNTLLNSSK